MDPHQMLGMRRMLGMWGGGERGGAGWRMDYSEPIPAVANSTSDPGMRSKAGLIGSNICSMDFIRFKQMAYGF